MMNTVSIHKHNPGKQKLSLTLRPIAKERKRRATDGVGGGSYDKTKMMCDKRMDPFYRWENRDRGGKKAIGNVKWYFALKISPMLYK